MCKRRAAKEPEAYDREHLTPMIRGSICTGEKLAGFYDARDHSFHDVMLIRDTRDEAEFRARFGIEGEIPTQW